MDSPPIPPPDAEKPAFVPPTIEQVAWMLERLCATLDDGASFRKLIYDRMGFGPEAYPILYRAGGMRVNNALIAVHDITEHRGPKDVR